MAPPAAFAPPPAPRRSGMPVWLIVLLVVIFVFILIAGTLGVLAYTGFRRYITLSKTAEATSTVNSIALAASSAYDADLALCASTSRPVPATIAEVKAKKYASTPFDWQTDAASNAGFACLKFQMDWPQYYQYDYRRTGSGKAAGDSFQAIAHGDLDGDGVNSEYTRGGTIVGASLVLDPSVAQKNPGE